MSEPRAWATIDLAAIMHNTRLLDQVAGDAELCAVVKANGYGHGAAVVARAAVAAGATRLAVAQVQEAAVLRSAGIDTPILVLGEPTLHEFDDAARLNLDVTAYSPRAIGAARNAGVPVHINVDTGMHRSGCSVDDAVELVRQAEPASMWTHLAVADEPDNPYTASQLDRFEAVINELERVGMRPPLLHAANTAGTLLHPRARHDMVRCGIGLYGLAPSSAQIGLFDLRPALRLETTVSFVKRLKAGDRVSYGLRRAVERDTTVATLPIGYADGVRRSLWKEGTVLIGGKHRQILGVVTMDQIAVDCGNDAVSAGDEAVLIGSQGEATVSADDWARWLNTINYEIVCGVTERVGRRAAATQ